MFDSRELDAHHSAAYISAMFDDAKEEMLRRLADGELQRVVAEAHKKELP